MTITLNQILPIENKKEYKVHIASNDKDRSGQPLDVFVQDTEDKKNWKSWNEWRPKNNDFNQKYIFSMMDFYHEKDTWLFGGIYEVLPGGSGKPGEGGYKVKLIEHARGLIGRLKISFKRPRRSRNRSLTLEKYYRDMTVSEILKEQYSGEKFCGYENINHEFRELEAIFNQRPDWKAALEVANGIYAIHDKSNDRKYIGAAYSDEGGVWARWSQYMETGHGGNAGLKELLKKGNKEGKKDKDYARENFVFSLLEYRPMSTDAKTMIKRENYWKNVFLSRGDSGYNKN